MKENTCYNGDCLDLMKEIQDKSIDFILCDLPYGITARNRWDSIIPLDLLWEQYERIIKDNGAIALTAVQPFTSLLVSSKVNLFKYEWIWQKQQGTGFLNAKKQPLRNHESILIFYKEQCLYNPQMRTGFKPYKMTRRGDTTNYNNVKELHWTSESDGDRYPITVLDFPYDKSKIHPTQKPVALFEYLIKTYTNEGEIVLDNCAGSMTTAIACRNTNRKFICIEKDAEIYQKGIDRLNGKI